jgi:hypothetical protein
MSKNQLEEIAQAWVTFNHANSEITRLNSYARLSHAMKLDRVRHHANKNQAVALLDRVLRPLANTGMPATAPAANDDKPYEGPF